MESHLEGHTQNGLKAVEKEVWGTEKKGLGLLRETVWGTPWLMVGQNKSPVLLLRAPSGIIPA